jgi:CxxC motif-containing protein (DUF1111 family)
MTTYSAVSKTAIIAFALSTLCAPSSFTFAQPIDPGVRQSAVTGGAPTPLADLSADELAFYQDGLSRFTTVEVVSGASDRQGNGLGPRFNSDQCSSCHMQPYVGGSSPAANPLVAVAATDGATNTVPWFITSNGPIREARFVKSNGAADGSVHALFVITGRTDAGTCNISQPNFLPAGNAVTAQGGNSNIVYRIPTPLYGDGLIEAISDATILANMNANSTAKTRAGVRGHPNAVQGGNVNLSANDGTITRFGWKAQNKSLLMFAGEAYNVEMGISNQLFPQERDETPNCQGATAAPNDTSNFSASTATAMSSDIEAFANFTRMLAPPTPAPATVSTQRGKVLFGNVGCSLCHTPTLTTGTAIASGSGSVPSAALSNRPANLYSDLLVHHMGSGLADGITQGNAGPDEFRTAPLWGIGQRVYFLHDGRTSDIVKAVEDHASPGSEANQVIHGFNALSAQQQQDLINFLRAL